MDLDAVRATYEAALAAHEAALNAKLTNDAALTTAQVAKAKYDSDFTNSLQPLLDAIAALHAAFAAT